MAGQARPSWWLTPHAQMGPSQPAKPTANPVRIMGICFYILIILATKGSFCLPCAGARDFAGLRSGDQALARTSSLDTDLTRNTRAPHFTPQHWLLCHMGMY